MLRLTRAGAGSPRIRSCWRPALGGRADGDASGRFRHGVVPGSGYNGLQHWVLNASAFGLQRCALKGTAPNASAITASRPAGSWIRTLGRRGTGTLPSPAGRSCAPGSREVRCARRAVRPWGSRGSEIEKRRASPAGSLPPSLVTAPNMWCDAMRLRALTRARRPRQPPGVRRHDLPGRCADHRREAHRTWSDLAKIELLSCDSRQQWTRRAP